MNLSQLRVDTVKGIGEESAKALGGLGINTVQDLLEFFFHFAMKIIPLNLQETWLTKTE